MHETGFVLYCPQLYSRLFLGWRSGLHRSQGDLSPVPTENCGDRVAVGISTVSRPWLASVGSGLYGRKGLLMKNRTKILFSSGILLFFVPFFANAACPTGQSQKELLYFATGSDAIAGAHNVSSLPLTGLQSGDSLEVHITVDCRGATCSTYSLLNGATTITAGAIAALATPAKQSAVIFLHGTVSTGSVILSNSLGATYLLKQTAVAAWVAPWTLNLAVNGSASASDWTWAIYKNNGSGNCNAFATLSASTTEATINIDAENRTMVYVAILALALAAFNSAAFWAWRIVKGTKKEI